MCEEYETFHDRTGQPVVGGQSSSSFVPIVIKTEAPLDCDDRARKDLLLHQCGERIETLPQQNRVIKISTDAGFLKTVEVGTKDQCRAFLKNIVTSSSCVCQVFLSFVSLLSLHTYLFSVTTLSVTEFVGEDQINTPAHWNLVHREHRNSPRHPKIRGIFLTDRVRHQLMVEPPATIDLVFCFSRGSCCFAEDLVVCLRMARRNMVVYRMAHGRLLADGPMARGRLRIARHHPGLATS